MTLAGPQPAGPVCFCRDCLGDCEPTARRCGQCGSPRLLRHPALSALTLAHIDCDAFYATVEKRDCPELADRPVIIGGGKRGVVSAAFETDIRDFATLERMLWRLSEKVSSRLKTGGVAGSTITLKLKTADFRPRTRAQSIPAPTQLAAKIFAVSRQLLAKEIDGTAFRLMGTGVSALCPGTQADDSDMLDRRSADAERAIDGLRKKFGEAAVIRGIAYEGPEKPR